jgi:hypothetical protein
VRVSPGEFGSGLLVICRRVLRNLDADCHEFFKDLFGGWRRTRVCRRFLWIPDANLGDQTSSSELDCDLGFRSRVHLSSPLWAEVESKVSSEAGGFSKIQCGVLTELGFGQNAHQEVLRSLAVSGAFVEEFHGSRRADESSIDSSES